MRQPDSASDATEPSTAIDRRGALKTLAGAGAGVVGGGSLLQMASTMGSAMVAGPPGGGGGEYQDSFADTDDWHYYEGGTGEDADSRLHQEHSASLLYYGHGPNPAGNEWLHQFRMLGYTIAREDLRTDDGYHLAKEIREQRLSIDEDQSQEVHGLFNSTDDSQVGVTPVPESRSNADRNDWYDLAYTAASVALSRGTYVGAALSATQVANALVGVVSDDGGGADISDTTAYEAWERPEQASYFVDFYVETSPGVDCQFTAASGATGEVDLGVTFDVEKPTPDHSPE